VIDFAGSGICSSANLADLITDDDAMAARSIGAASRRGARPETIFESHSS
jgi:hypothetical protein